MKLLLISTLYRIKTKHPKLWSVIEKINSWIFGIFYARLLHHKLALLMKLASDNTIVFRLLTRQDKTSLLQLLNSLEPELTGYFEAHDFTDAAIIKHLNNKGFIMIGAFHGGKLVGYFFLRAGINKKCFVGRLIHRDFRNKGIGSKMTRILHHASWQSGYRVFATLSPHNTPVIQSHKNNDNMKLLKELPDNYWLVEFVKPTSS